MASEDDGIEINVTLEQFYSDVEKDALEFAEAFRSNKYGVADSMRAMGFDPEWLANRFKQDAEEAANARRTYLEEHSDE